MTAPSRRPLVAASLVLLLAAGGGVPATAAGTLTFTSTPGPTVGNVLAAQVALVDGDDVPDLVTGVVGEGFVVERGRGDGTFRAAERYAVPHAAYGVSVGDVTGDGVADVVALSNGAAPQLVVFRGTGDGSGPLVRQDQTSTVAPSGYATVLADLDADGALDVALPVGGTVHVYAGTRSGGLPDGRFSFARSVPAASATSVFAPAVSDLNGDGRPDLVLPPKGGRVGVLLSDPAATEPFRYLPHVTTTALGGLDVAVGDLDGRPGEEIAYASGTRAGHLTWSSGTTFTDTVLSTALTSATGVSVADYDRDGLADIGTVDTTGTGSLQRFWTGQAPLLAGGPRTFAPSTTTRAVDRGSAHQASADVDVDGTPDVVLTSSSARRTLVLVNTSGPAATRAPSLTLQPAATTALEGTAVSLTAAAAGTPDSEVRWERRLPGSTSWTLLAEGDSTEVRSGASVTSTWTGPAEPALDGAGYRAVFTGAADGARPATTDTAVVTVVRRTPPSFVTPPAALQLREGADAVFGLVAAGAPAPSVTWAVAAPGTSDFRALAGTGPVLTVPKVTPAHDGSTYRATLTSTEGTVSALATLGVDPLPVLVAEPADLGVRPGEPARFAVEARSADVHWERSTDAGRSWAPVGVPGPVLELGSTTLAQNGTRLRAVLSPWGTSAGTRLLSRAALLAVDAAPGAPLSLAATESRPGALTVSWAPPASTTDLKGWSLSVDGTTSTPALSARSAVVTGLPVGSHLVELRAVDAVGPGALATLRASTTGTATPSPTPAATASPTSSPRVSASPSRSPSASPTASAVASAPRTAAPSPSPSSAVPVAPPAPPAAPEDAGVDPTLRVAAPVVAAGGLARLSGTAAPGEVLELLAYVRPGTTYRVLRTATADDDGRFSFDVRPTGNMRAYVRTADERVSPSVVQAVRSAVSLTVTSSAGRRVVFRGVVWPKHAGQLVNLYTVSGSGLRLLGQARTDAAGAYRDDHVYARAGRSTVVAVVPRTVVTETGRSVQRTAVARP